VPFIAGGVVALAFFILWLYCIFDVISTEEGLPRNMPKMVWLLVVIFLPTVGSLAWLFLGRPLNAGLAPGSTEYFTPPKRPARDDRPAPKGPDDSPEFLSRLDGRARELKRWEEDLKRREDELRGKDGGDPPPGDES
jgi:Phospholipase_D-nuclease N-terminal